MCAHGGDALLWQLRREGDRKVVFEVGYRLRICQRTRQPWMRRKSRGWRETRAGRSRAFSMDSIDARGDGLHERVELFFQTTRRALPQSEGPCWLKKNAQVPLLPVLQLSSTTVPEASDDFINVDECRRAFHLGVRIVEEVNWERPTEDVMIDSDPHVFAHERITHGHGDVSGEGCRCWR